MLFILFFYFFNRNKTHSPIQMSGYSYMSDESHCCKFPIRVNTEYYFMLMFISIAQFNFMLIYSHMLCAHGTKDGKG